MIHGSHLSCRLDRGVESISSLTLRTKGCSTAEYNRWEYGSYTETFGRHICIENLKIVVLRPNILHTVVAWRYIQDAHWHRFYQAKRASIVCSGHSCNNPNGNPTEQIACRTTDALKRIHSIRFRRETCMRLPGRFQHWIRLKQYDPYYWVPSNEGRTIQSWCRYSWVLKAPEVK